MAKSKIRSDGHGPTGSCIIVIGCLSVLAVAGFALAVITRAAVNNDKPSDWALLIAAGLLLWLGWALGTTPKKPL